MISKERLKELIEQGATIWTVNSSGNINPVKTNKTCEIQRQYLMKEGQIYSYIEQTFETKEEAEWYREFGCIEKLQYLKFPNWKQIESFMEYMRKFGLNHNDRVLARIITSDSIYYFKLCKDLDIFTFQLKQTYIGDDLCEQISDKFPKSLGKATEENYTLACRKAKELFLGEKENVR